MNIPENREQLEELVLRYLYNDLDSADRAAFEQALASNPQLREILEQEQNLVGHETFLARVRARAAMLAHWPGTMKAGPD